MLGNFIVFRFLYVIWIYYELYYILNINCWFFFRNNFLGEKKKYVLEMNKVVFYSFIKWFLVDVNVWEELGRMIMLRKGYVIGGC